MADDAKPRLKLTDTPNVAQVIRIVREMQREDRWLRRLRRAIARKLGLHPTAVTREGHDILEASEKRRRIDAGGKVIAE